MLYLVLLIIFLIQFLVVLGALTFAVFLARPEVPFLGGGLMERTANDSMNRSLNAHVPRFSYHLTFPVEAPMVTTSGRPSPFMSATTTPDAAICVSRVWRSHFSPRASAA